MDASEEFAERNKRIEIKALTAMYNAEGAPSPLDRFLLDVAHLHTQAILKNPDAAISDIFDPCYAQWNMDC